MKTKTATIEQEPEFEIQNEMIELPNEFEHVEEKNSVQDFNLQDAVIYSAILNGTWDDH